MDVRLLTAADEDLIGPAVEVLAEGLGAGYLTAGHLRDLNCGRRPAAGVFVALAGDELAGVGTTDLASPELLERVAEATGAAGRRWPGLPEGRTGQLRTNAVRPAFRRRGVGTELTARRLAHLRAAGCTAAVALSWCSGAADTSAGVLRAHGLVPVVDIADYWRTDDDTGPACPVCGHPCRCTAAVYALCWPGDG